MKTINQMPLRMASIISIMFLCISTTFGQERSTQELLMSNDWVISYPKGSISAIGWRFTKTELIQFVEEKMHTSELVGEYYLSDTDKVGAEFNQSKVGKTKTGKYLVYTFNQGSYIYIQEFVELSDSVLSVKDLKAINSSPINPLKARPKAKYAKPEKIKKVKPIK